SPVRWLSPWRTRGFAGDHHGQQCISPGTGAPGHTFLGIVRDVPADSRGFLMVITQEPTEPLATLHRPSPTHFRDPRKQQDVGLPLMIALGMVMRNIFAQRPPQGALPKENDLRQTLLLHGP